MTIFEQFTHQYKISKTLRFELIPQGKTLEHIEQKGLLKEDADRLEDYIVVKTILDKVHKTFIENTLQEVELSWQPLAKSYTEAKQQGNKEILQKQQKKYRTLIKNWFRGDLGSKEFKKLQKNLFDNLFKAEFFKLIKDNNFSNLTQHEINYVKKFDGFATYFTGYHIARENIYTSDEVSTSIPYRIVHDNFPKFLDACAIYDTVKASLAPSYPDIWQEICSLPHIFTKAITLQKDNSDTFQKLKLAEKIYQNLSIDDIFSVEFYNKLLSQNQIDFFNQLIGGITIDSHTKLQGFNEIINLALQQNPDLTNDFKNKPHKINPLYKQILSDRSTLSFIIDTFKTDAEVFAAIKEYQDYLADNSILEKTSNLLTYLESADKSKIYLSYKSLTNASQELLKDWSLIKSLIATDLKKALKGKEETKNEKVNKIINKTDYDLDYIDSLLAKEENLEKSFVSAFIEHIKAQLSIINENNHANLPNALKTNDEKNLVREALEKYSKLYQLLSYFIVDANNDKNLEFYNKLEEITDNLSLIIPLFNKVRNYATKKPYSEEKYKLNFQEPTLGKGWSLKKEPDYLIVLLYKEGNYYLGVINKNDKPNFNVYNNNTALISDHLQPIHCYQKMIYTQLNIARNLTRCGLPTQVGTHFATNSEPFIHEGSNFIEPLVVTKEIYDLFKKEKTEDDNSSSNASNKKSEKEKLIKQISFGIDFLKKYSSTYFYDYSSLKSPEQYESMKEFYDDVNNILYKLRFVPIPDKDIESFINSGKLYLFQIYNKDFSPYATGKPNLHTLYWKAIFANENLQDMVVKLNGKAELFYRKHSDMEVFSHNEGEKLVNKTYISENNEKLPIDDNLYKEFTAYARGEISKDDLSTEAKAILPKVVIKDVKHKITKDRRYTLNKFFFHVPITLNFKSSNKPSSFNKQVQKCLSTSDDVNIIGIDRGERHLLYLVVINSKGEIIDNVQINLNKINGYNYNTKLQQRENERLNARQTWTTIDKIKDMKQGYLSLAVHEITKLMIKYNAIVVLESLNSGFKRSRSGISEKSIYQNFEKMLINKLNYLVFKDISATEPGGILNAYQLTAPFESFKKLSSQSGFIFYVPASYTSKIDPLTGFINPFKTKHITNFDKRKEFISLFSSLKYDKNLKAYVLSCDLNNGFPLTVKGPKTKWDIRLAGDRIVYNSKDKQKEYINIETCLDEILQKYALEDKSGADILPKLRAWEDKTNDVISKLYKLIISTLSLRNSDDKNDYIASPVANSNGIYFDSRANLKGLPQDADANGAYHIALKGLCILNRLKNSRDDEKINLNINQNDWLKFMQTR